MCFSSAIGRNDSGDPVFNSGESAFALAEKRCLAMIGEVKRSCDQQTSRVLIGYRNKTNMSNLDLPSEIWTQIFDLAADEDLIFQYGLPTSMAESAWFKSVIEEWALRTPQEALNLIQRRSYATKKASCLH